jgi:glycosyltransferase involved in cell wall biosynthesis
MVGKEVDSSWKQKVIEKRNEFGLESTVSIEEEANEIALLFAQVQAGLVVSEREGLPVALLEYGLGSLPVISTRVGQCPAVLNEGEFGKLVPFGDPEALANSMREMLLNPENSEKLGVSFRRHVESRYGPGQFLSAYFDILEQLNFTRK